MKGKFIVIEGLDGAGKTTAIQIVEQKLRQYRITDCCFTREPGGTPLAEELRKLIKNQTQEPISAISELLMIYASRLQLVENVIYPALKKGTWVIGDRHDLSTQAYQGGGRELDSDILMTLKKITLGKFEPDFTLYLDIEPRIGLERVAKQRKLDRFEQEALPFFERIRQRYRQLAQQNENIVMIDAEQPLETVKLTICQALEAWLLENAVAK